MGSIPTMRFLILGLTLLLAISLTSGRRGRGHHHGHLVCSNGCKPTCTNGAMPLCADGSRPHHGQCKDSSTATCTDGATPVCPDGSSPTPKPVCPNNIDVELLRA